MRRWRIYYHELWHLIDELSEYAGLIHACGLVAGASVRGWEEDGKASLSACLALEFLGSFSRNERNTGTDGQSSDPHSHPGFLFPLLSMGFFRV